jgi:hypothetical protein
VPPGLELSCFSIFPDTKHWVENKFKKMWLFTMSWMCWNRAPVTLQVSHSCWGDARNIIIKVDFKWAETVPRGSEGWQTHNCCMKSNHVECVSVCNVWLVVQSGNNVAPGQTPVDLSGFNAIRKIKFGLPYIWSMYYIFVAVQPWNSNHTSVELGAVLIHWVLIPDPIRVHILGQTKLII